MTARDTAELVEFLNRRFPASAAATGMLGLMGEDPDHSAEWWAAKVEQLIRAEGWRPAVQPIHDDDPRVWRPIGAVVGLPKMAAPPKLVKHRRRQALPRPKRRVAGAPALLDKGRAGARVAIER